MGSRGRRALAVAKAHMLELSRRRAALTMLVLLPLVFYWTSSSENFAPTFATVGVGWAFSIATLFLTSGMRLLAPRLGLVGFSAAEQLIGRLLCAVGFGAIVATGLWLYIGRDEMIVNHRHLALSLLFSLTGAVAAGLAVGALVPREMEAMLLLIGMVGLQLVVDHQSTFAKILPLYAAERYAASASGWAQHVDGAAQATVIVSAVLLALAVIGTFIRAPRTRNR